MKGGVWVASYVMLWIAVLVLGLACAALLRQLGVLHARLRPLGGHFAGEGLEPGTPAPGADRFAYHDSRVTLLAFTSRNCHICQEMLPSLLALDRQYADVAVHHVDHDGDAPLFGAFNVRSTPYFVTVDRDGIVQARGVANSLEQVEVLLEEASEEVHN